MHSIGIMQGRLVPPMGERIQAFPEGKWRDEFPAAQKAGLDSIEWIFDVGQDHNPIATEEGIAEMQSLGLAHGIKVRSLCADYFMVETLLKGTPDHLAQRTEKLQWLLVQCHKAGIGHVVLPFVDSSSLEGDEEMTALVSLVHKITHGGGNHGIELHLETSLPPKQFADLLRAIDHPHVKVNYDSGNSSSLGFDVDEEFAAYGHSIGSVHIKDRIRGGGTVPLGTGNADFERLLRNLGGLKYGRAFILQVARRLSGDEINSAIHDRMFLQKCIERFF